MKIVKVCPRKIAPDKLNRPGKLLKMTAIGKRLNPIPNTTGVAGYL